MRILATFEVYKADLSENKTEEVILEYDTLPGYISEIEQQILKFESDGYKANLIAEQEINEGSDEVN